MSRIMLQTEDKVKPKVLIGEIEELLLAEDISTYSIEPFSYGQGISLRIPIFFPEEIDLDKIVAVIQEKSFIEGSVKLTVTIEAGATSDMLD